MTAVRVRGVALPDGEVVDLVADGDRWTDDPVAGADPVIDGWLVPGLVDVHTHPGVEEHGRTLDEDMLRAHLRAHLATGVTAIRAPGIAGDPPAWFGADPDLPRAQHAGWWIAQPGQFFDGWGVRGAPAEIPALAAAQAARSGWAKVIGDWLLDDPALTVEVLTRTVAAVHAAGGRLAVHVQSAEGSRAAALAGVDSIEHGQGLDPALLPGLRATGSVLVPTLHVIEQSLARRRARGDDEDAPRVATGRVHGALAAAAAEEGVTVLAGTDTVPGSLGVEIRALAAAGLGAHRALGAGSWAAREFLGLGGLEAGAPADVTVYDRDPRTDLSCLEHPVAVVLRGRVHRPG